MKTHLGKTILLLCIPLLLFADTDQAQFSLTANKTSAYVKEAITITFVAKQKEHTYVMFFFLEPKKSHDYEIKLLNKKTTELAYHDSTTTFTYLLFPLKAKKIDVDFDFTIKVASDEAVAQVYQGSRDNTKWIETIDTKVALQPITIDVKDLEKKVDLVGDFQLSSKLLNKSITEYDALNISYKLTGEGYKDKEFQILNKIEGTTIFSQTSDAFSLATQNGYKISREYSYAIVAKEDFTIPEIKIQAYSPKLHKYYTLVDKEHSIKVTQMDSSTLIDTQESPKKETFDFHSFQEFFIAIIIFVSGFISAKLSPLLQPYTRKRKKFQDIFETKTSQELLLLLIEKYPKDGKKYINELEKIQYRGTKKSFHEIKALLLKEFTQKS